MIPIYRSTRLRANKLKARGCFSAQGSQAIVFLDGPKTGGPYGHMAGAEGRPELRKVLFPIAVGKNQTATQIRIVEFPARPDPIAGDAR